MRPSALYHGRYHWRYDDELLLDDGHTVRICGLDADEGMLSRNFFIVEAATLAPPIAD